MTGLPPLKVAGVAQGLRGKLLKGCWNKCQKAAHLLHHDRVGAFEGDVDIHVVLQRPDPVGCQEACSQKPQWASVTDPNPRTLMADRRRATALHKTKKISLV